jgi:hypothetical protein
MKRRRKKKKKPKKPRPRKYKPMPHEECLECPWAAQHKIVKNFPIGCLRKRCYIDGIWRPLCEELIEIFGTE